jgi:hypothetical protein
MKKYLIPAFITAVAVGAFLVFQNAGYVQTVQLSTWRPVADLSEATTPAWGLSSNPFNVRKSYPFKYDPGNCEYRLGYAYKIQTVIQNYLYPVETSQYRMAFQTLPNVPFEVGHSLPKISKGSSSGYNPMMNPNNDPNYGMGPMPSTEDIQKMDERRILIINAYSLNSDPKEISTSLSISDYLQDYSGKPLISKMVGRVILESRCYTRKDLKVFDDSQDIKGISIRDAKKQ